MANTERRLSPLAAAIEGFLFAAVYVGLDLLGRALLHNWAAGLPWYPPVGVATAYVIVRGRRAAPWLFIARAVLTIGPGHTIPFFPGGIVHAALATALTLALAALFRRLPNEGPAAWRTPDATRFVALAGLSGAAYGAVAGAVDRLAGTLPVGGYVAFALRYGIGDAIGIAVVVPAALLLWPRRSPALGRSRTYWTTLVGGMAAAGVALGLVELATGNRSFYLALLPLGWAALGGGLPGAAIAVLALDGAITTTWAFAAQLGHPFATGLTELQTFMLVASAGALLLGAATGALDAELAQRREAEERLRAVVDQPVAGIYTIADDRFVFVNEHFASILGYTPEEMLAMPSAYDPLAPEEKERVRASIARRVAGVEPEAHYRLTAVRKDGQRVLLEVHAVGTTVGGRRATVGLVIDRTALATIEAALRERDEQLRQAQKMEAIGQLAGGVAHDFNNMLTAISTNVSLALQEVDASTDPRRAVRESLVEIRDAAARAAALTRQLLAFGRKQMLRPKAVRLDTIVRDTLPLLRRLVEADVRIEPRLAAGDGTVVVDPTQIEQVLLNLVVNARDAMRDSAEKLLTIATACVDLSDADARDGPHARPGLQPGRYVVLSVRDTGQGMDAATRERIFEPFFTTKAPGVGTGLGLSTVFGIVNQSGGHIYVDSTPGCGASFSIYLHETVARAADVPNETAAAARTPGAAPDGEPVVLVVEDEDAVRRVLRRALTAAGYRVIEAGDPAEALRRWPSIADDVRLVVTDVMMPEMDGRQLAAALRAQRPELPILMMSGYSEAPAGPSEIERLPNTGWLDKPFTARELRDAVATLLDGAPAR